jgi:ribonuclease P protein component
MNLLLVIRQGKRRFGGVADGIFLQRKSANRANRDKSEVKVVVSQKVAKHAVVRHKIQRRLREIIRHSLPKYRSVAQGYDIVFMARPPAKEASFSDLQDAIHKILNSL